MSVPLGTLDRAVLTARAGILRAGTGRAGAVFAVNQMTQDSTGRYLWEDRIDDIADSTVWTAYTSDEN